MCRPALSLPVDIKMTLQRLWSNRSRKCHRIILKCFTLRCLPFWRVKSTCSTSSAFSLNTRDDSCCQMSTNRWMPRLKMRWQPHQVSLIYVLNVFRTPSGGRLGVLTNSQPLVKKWMGSWKSEDRRDLKQRNSRSTALVNISASQRVTVIVRNGLLTVFKIKVCLSMGYDHKGWSLYSQQ